MVTKYNMFERFCQYQDHLRCLCPFLLPIFRHCMSSTYFDFSLRTKVKNHHGEYCVAVCELTNKENANCVATLLSNLSKDTSLALNDLGVNTLHKIVYQWHLLWIRVIGVLRSHVWLAFFSSKQQSVITKGAQQGCTDYVLCPVLCIQHGQCW